VLLPWYDFQRKYWDIHVANTVATQQDMSKYLGGPFRLFPPASTGGEGKEASSTIDVKSNWVWFGLICRRRPTAARSKWKRMILPSDTLLRIPVSQQHNELMNLYMPRPPRSTSQYVIKENRSDQRNEFEDSKWKSKPNSVERQA